MWEVITTISEICGNFITWFIVFVLLMLSTAFFGWLKYVLFDRQR